MTENEIREMVQSLRNRLETFASSGWAIDGLINDYTKSADTIEKLLDELEQYRAIGTVEELEARKKSTLSAMELADIWCILEDLKKYSAIGTIDEFKALKEKNTPKKVAYQGEHEKCPSCGSFHVFGKHCTECGQAVDYD